MNKSLLSLTTLALLLCILAVSQVHADPGEQPRARAFPHSPAVARDAKDPSCRACHASVPEPDVAPAEAGLMMGPEGTCTMCHRGPPHPGAAEHLGKPVAAEVRAQLPPSVALGPEGTIGCFSCHEPHLDATSGADAPSSAPADTSTVAAQIRALVNETGWDRADAPRLMWPPVHGDDLPVMLSLPLEGGALCTACHAAGPSPSSTRP